MNGCLLGLSEKAGTRVESRSMAAKDEELEAILDEEADEMLDEMDTEEQTLHEAMQQVLEEGGGSWMPVRELARIIYERNLYRRKDRGVIPPADPGSSSQISRSVRGYDRWLQSSSPASAWPRLGSSRRGRRGAAA